METGNRRNWGLIVAGALLVICGIFIYLMPLATLVTITALAGAAFLVSGIFDIVSYVRYRNVMPMTGWVIAYAVLDLVIGVMFLLHPYVLSAVIPWLLGAFFIVFGVFEVVGSFRARDAGVPAWGWMLFSGIVGALCGLSFILWPVMLSLFIALFVLMRGISLAVYGFTVGRNLA